MKDLVYTVTTNKNFKAAVDSVVHETDVAGFRVLHIHDVQETLSKKDLSIEPLKIIEICNAKNAYSVIQKDINLALILPCKINVYVKGGQVFISALRPLMMSKLYPDDGLDDLVAEVDEKLKIIVEQAK